MRLHNRWLQMSDMAALGQRAGQFDESQPSLRRGGLARIRLHPPAGFPHLEGLWSRGCRAAAATGQRLDGVPTRHLA